MVNSASQEAALKYFLLSVFSSALLLFGFSYLYGLAGTTNLPAVMQAFVEAGRDTSAEQAAAVRWPSAASANSVRARVSPSVMAGMFVVPATP